MFRATSRSVFSAGTTGSSGCFVGSFGLLADSFAADFVLSSSGAFSGTFSWATCGVLATAFLAATLLAESFSSFAFLAAAPFAARVNSSPEASSIFGLAVSTISITAAKG